MARGTLRDFFTYPPLDTCKRNRILFSETGSAWSVVNDSFFNIAQALDGGIAPADIVAALCDEFSLTNDEASAHVDAVLSYLVSLPTTENSRLVRTPRLDGLFIHMTTRCNLRCAQCYYTRSKASALSGAHICEMLDELSRNGGRSVTLSGGEPLLHPDFKVVAHHAADLGLEIRVLTNGTRIDDEWATFLVETGCHIQISLDGSTSEIHDQARGKGAFAATMKGLDFLQKAGIEDRVHFSATVMRSNFNDLENIVALGQKAGVSLVRFLPLRPEGRAEDKWQDIGQGLTVDDYESMFDRMAALRKIGLPFEITCGLSGFVMTRTDASTPDDMWCPVGTTLVLEADGTAYPCVLMMQDEFQLGNVNEQSISEIVASQPMAAVCEMFSRRHKSISACGKCHWRSLCQGGCVGQAVDATGRVDVSDPFCAYRKKMYRSSFDQILSEQE